MLFLADGRATGRCGTPLGHLFPVRVARFGCGALQVTGVATGIVGQLFAPPAHVVRTLFHPTTHLRAGLRSEQERGDSTCQRAEQERNGG